jgi:hypothetical protein
MKVQLAGPDGAGRAAGKSGGARQAKTGGAKQNGGQKAPTP